LKPLLGGPFFDLEAVWEEHTRYEFGERDVEKTMATMVEQPYVNHIPTMTYVTSYQPRARLRLLIMLQRRHRQRKPHILLHSPLRLLQPPGHLPLPRLPHRRHRPRNRRVHLHSNPHQARSLATSWYSSNGQTARHSIHQYRRYAR
jgi:hypothetical protein